MATSAPDEKTFYQQLPQWFIAIVGLSYVTGYEIEFLYYGSLGILDAAGEIFKLKYIQTGVVFLFPCALITAFIIALLNVSRINFKRSLARRKFYFTRWVFGSTLFNFGSMYFLVLFTPLHYFETTPHWSGILFFIFLIIFSTSIYDFSDRRHVDRYAAMRKASPGGLAGSQIKALHRLLRDDVSLRDAIAMLSSALVLLVDIVLLYGRRSSIGDLLVHGGLVFFVLTLLIPMILHRLMYRLKDVNGVKDSSQNFRHNAISGMSMAVFALLLLLLLTSYSYRVFPFVPNLKGGADYENAPLVSVTLKSADPAKSNNPSGSVLLYTSSSSYYFARPERGNDPCDWRVGRKRPEIIELRREEISALSYRAVNELSARTNCMWEKQAPPKLGGANAIAK